jgi:hypothetical protein
MAIRTIRLTRLSGLMAVVLGSPADAGPGDVAAVGAAVKAIFAPYSRPDPKHELNIPSAANRPIYSAATTALLKRWQNAIPNDEVTALGDADWICQCQDYDPKTARIISLAIKSTGSGKYDADVVYSAGFNSKERMTIKFVSERARWRVDDMAFGANHASLRAALRQEIAEAGKQK